LRESEFFNKLLDYTLRDMRSPEGGFYSAEDADSLLEHGQPEHAEGAFYVWEAAEIERVLGAGTAAVFNYHYGVEPSGNVPAQRDIQGELKGRNILIVRHSVAETAKKSGKPPAEVEKLLTRAREKLFHVHAKRPRPPLDDKVLTAWNGLMISALARAAQALEEPKYREAAEAAARFLQREMYDAKAGQLQRRHREGEAAIQGFLEDYAYLIQGLLDLYEASFDVRWLEWAVRLQEKQDKLFWDAKTGGYFTTTGEDPSFLFRMREDYDGAEPAGNSVAALNLLRLAEIADRDDWRQKARRTFAVFGKQLEGFPQSMPQLVAALDFALSKPKQIIIAGEPGAKDTRALLRLVHDRFIPNKVLLLADGAQGQEQLAGWLPFVKFIKRKDGRATAYVCENYVCKLPTPDPEVVARLLDGNT
jgi:uncharacterized protein YyaL (SSP411 family)